MEEDIDIKWLEEYAEQEKKYKWGKEIKKLINRNKELEKYKRKHSLVKNNYIPKSKLQELLKNAEEKYQTYKKGVDENENLKFGMWRYLGQVQILKDLLGISRNIATLDSEELLQEGDK